MKRVLAFLYFISVILSCSAQVKALKPADFGIITRDKKGSLFLIQKHKLSIKSKDITPQGVNVVLNPVTDYQVIVSIDVKANIVETTRGIRVGDNKNKIEEKYGKGKEGIRDGTTIISYILDDYEWGELGEIYPFIGVFLLEFIIEKTIIKEIRMSVEYGF
jgi:hypothetical protein